MASNKAKMLEKSLQDDLHPFAARMSPTPASDEDAKKTTTNDQTVARSSDHETDRSSDRTTKRSFDLNKNAAIRRAFNFTEEELYAIEDLKRDLSRSYDVQVTLYDVVRIGVHEIVEDYQEKGDKSIVVKRAKAKIPK